MKKIYLIYVLAFVLCSAVQAQPILQGADQVKNLQISRNNNNVSVAMDVDISNIEVGADETVVLTPYIEKNGKELRLPSIEVMGRRAYLYFLRSGEVTVTPDPLYSERVAKRAERKNGKAQLVNYATNVVFEEWMRGGNVVVKEESCGCNSELIAQDEKQIGRFLHEIYNPQYIISFIEPEPEPVKVRDESHTAYINFKVDKYDILEDYKNNNVELASIINSINKVKEDEDLTITSIAIEGWASPEATQQHNQTLSQNRANSLSNYVAEKTGIARDRIEAIGRGEDWKGLRELVVATPRLLSQDKVLAVIDDSSLTLDQKDKKLEDMIPPTIYQRLMNEMYPKLRRNDYRIVYNVRNFNLEEARALIDSDPRKLSLSEMYRVAGSYAKDSQEYKKVMAIAAKTYPQAVAAAVNHAAQQIAAKNYAGALQTLAATDREDARVLATEGYVYINMGDQAKARDAWTKAAAKGNAEAKHNLAELDKHLKSL